MNGISLFSGIGGIDIALKEWVRPIAYCEIDPYCQGVLLSRMAERDIPNAPIWDDVSSFPLESFTEQVDIIYGGFPCQDISIAGTGKGLEGKRSGLFFEIVRLAKEIKPKFIFLENVPAITHRGGLRVVREIAEMGYDCRWCVISAASVGAMHCRKRWFLLAHSNDNGSSTSENRASVGECLIPRAGEEEQKEGVGEIERTSSLSSNVADSDSARCKEQWRPCANAKEQPAFKCSSKICNANCESSEQADTSAKPKHYERFSWRKYSGQCWPFESVANWQKTVSEMDKYSDGLPYQVDRIRSLGNSVVPVQAKTAFKILMGIK